MTGRRVVASSSPLPRFFCWTRFGTEAGETIEAILERKERERQTTGGLFYWGIGSSVGPGIEELLRRTDRPEVLFSPIKSPPKRHDVKPQAAARWTEARGLGRESFELPETIRVTSRFNPEQPKAAHYALVCASGIPVERADYGELDFAALRNLRGGTPLGGSQTTAVVERLDSGERSGDAASSAGGVSAIGGSQASRGGRALYPVAFRAELTPPYFVRLSRPVLI